MSFNPLSPEMVIQMIPERQKILKITNSISIVNGDVSNG